LATNCHRHGNSSERFPPAAVFLLHQGQLCLGFPPIVGGETELPVEKHFHMTSDILQLIHGGTLPFKPGFRCSSLIMKVYHRGSPINRTFAWEACQYGRGDALRWGLFLSDEK